MNKAEDYWRCLGCKEKKLANYKKKQKKARKKKTSNTLNILMFDFKCDFKSDLAL